MAPRAPKEEAPVKPAWVGKLPESKSQDSSPQYQAIYDDLKAWIEAAYESWKIDPLDWRITEFETPEDADNAAKAGKWFAERRPEGALSFVRKKYDDEKNVLVYRVRDKISRPRDKKEMSEPAGVNLPEEQQTYEGPAPDAPAKVEAGQEWPET